jgi:hypothetical protein
MSGVFFIVPGDASLAALVLSGLRNVSFEQEINSIVKVSPTHMSNTDRNNCFFFITKVFW